MPFQQSRLRLFTGKLPVGLATFTLAVTTSSLVLATSCKKTESVNSTPIVSSPPSTAFPMPPMSGKSLPELGWVVLEREGETEKTTQTEQAKISDYSGKVLVLDLYATWCAPCRESIPHLINLQRRYEAQGVQVVGLNAGGPDDRIKVAAFAREFGIQYQLGFPERELADFLLSDDTSLPQTYVFSRDGHIAERFIGYDSKTAQALEQIIQSELAKNYKAGF